MPLNVIDYFKKVLLMTASCKATVNEVGLYTSFDDKHRFKFYVCVKVLGHYVTCNFRSDMSENDCKNNLKDAKTLLMGDKPTLKKPISKQFIRLMPYIISFLGKVERMGITVNVDSNDIDFRVQEVGKGYCQWHYAILKAGDDKDKFDNSISDMDKYLKSIKSDGSRNL